MTMSSGKETLCAQPIRTGPKMSKKNKSYSFRDCSIQKRKETEKNKGQPKKRGPKPRPKSAPMSKYRRKTANLRERLRMGEINHAFENLRQKLPNPVASGKGKCEKLTKINILHVAINYIRAMENLLETGESGVTSFSEMTKNPLRDENESKLEMQRILQVLMKKAEAKAAEDARLGVTSDNDPRRKVNTSRKRKYVFGAQKSKLKSEEMFEDEDSEIDDLDIEDSQEKMDNSVTFPDWKSLSSTLLPFPVANSKPALTTSTQKLPSITPSTNFFASTPEISTSTYSSHTSSPSSTSVSSVDSLVVPDVKLEQDPLFSSVSFDHVAAPTSDDMIKEFFTEFVDMVDTLPDIDFEDQFEMFP